MSVRIMADEAIRHILIDVFTGAKYGWQKVEET